MGYAGILLFSYPSLCRSWHTGKLVGGYTQTAIAAFLAATGITGAAFAEEEEPADWPLEVALQPNTLPARAWSVSLSGQANLEFDTISIVAGGMWGVSYGFTNNLTAGVSYQAPIRNEATSSNPTPGNLGQGPLLGQAAYSFFNEGDWNLVATVSAGYQFDAAQVAPLTLGTLVSWSPNPWFTLETTGNQFSIGLASPNEVTFSFPFVASAQLTERFFFSITTNLITVPLNDPLDQGVTIIGEGNIPASPNIIYSPTNQWGISAGASLVATAAGQATTVGSTLQWTLGVNYYGNVKPPNPPPPNAHLFD